MAQLYEYCNTGDTNPFSFTSSRWLGQTFTTTVPYTITSEKVKMQRGYSGTTPLAYIEIWKMDNTVLCSGSIAIGQFPYDSVGAWREVSLGAGSFLLPSTMYRVVAKYQYATANQINWRVDLTGTYPGGSLWYTDNGGATWTEYVGRDAMFENWGEPVDGQRLMPSMLIATGQI